MLRKILKVSNAWMNLWIMCCRKKRGSRSRIPRKDPKRMSMPAMWMEFRGFRI